MRGLNVASSIKMENPDSGREEEFFNMSQAAEYLGVSGPTLTKKLKEREQEGRPIKRFKPSFGRALLVRKADLDSLSGLRPESHYPDKSLCCK